MSPGSRAEYWRRPDVLERKAIQHKMLYHRRKARGECPRCGTSVVGTDFVQCARCREYGTRKRKESHARNLAAGRCRRCGKPKPPRWRGEYYCSVCRDRQRIDEARADY